MKSKMVQIGDRELRKLEAMSEKSRVNGVGASSVVQVDGGEVFKVKHVADANWRGVQTDGRNALWVEGSREGVEKTDVYLKAGLMDVNEG